MTWWRAVKPTPLRRQIDPIECGAVCLGIVLEAFGRVVDTKTLRTLSNVSRNGAGADAIIQAAKSLHLHGKAQKMLATDLKALTNPAILFFDSCHFVVFEGVRSGRYFINDPAAGRYTLDDRTMHKRFSRVVLQFEKGKDFVADSKPTWFQKHMAATRYGIAPCTFGLLAGVNFVLFARIVGVFLMVTPDMREAFLSSFILMTGVLLTGLCTALVSVDLLIMRRAKNNSAQETDQLLESLNGLSPTFFDDRPFVFFANALVSSIKRHHQAAKAHGMGAFWTSFLMIVGVALVVLWPVIGAIAAISGVIFLGVGTQLQNKAASFAKPSLLQDALLIHTLSQASSLLAMGQRELIIDGLLSATERNDVSARRLSPAYVIATVALVLGVMVIANSCALWLWHKGSFPLMGACELVLLCFGWFFAIGKMALRPRLPNDEVKSLGKEMQASQSLVTRVGVGHAIVHAEQVSFAFPGESSEVLQSITIAIHPGDIFGVVGESRAGASTMFKLLAGFLTPSKGHIAFGGIHNPKPRILLINQDTDVHGATIRDVVRLNDQSISDEAVVDALKAAHALELFYNRPMGLLAPIIAHGQNLSASEKMRLLLAQALVHRPALVLLDGVFGVIEPVLAKSIIASMRRLKIAAVFNSYDGVVLSESDTVIFLHHHTIHKTDRHEHLYFSDEAYRELVKPSVVEDGFV